MIQLNSQYATNIFSEARDAISSDPTRWHQAVGIDTEAVKRTGTPCPFGCGGEGTDRLHPMPSFDKDGAVCCRHEENRRYDGIEAFVASGKAADNAEAAKMLLELYGVSSSLPVAKPKAGSSKDWTYTDQKSNPLYQVTRIEYIEKGELKKRFIQKRYENGRYVAGLTAEQKQTGGVPLNWPELIRCQEETLFHCGRGKMLRLSYGTWIPCDNGQRGKRKRKAELGVVRSKS